MKENIKKLSNNLYALAIEEYTIVPCLNIHIYEER